MVVLAVRVAQLWEVVRVVLVERDRLERREELVVQGGTRVLLEV